MRYFRRFAFHCDSTVENHQFQLVAFVGSYTILTPRDSIINDEKGLSGKRLGVLAASIQETYANETYEDMSIVPFPDSAAMEIALPSGQIDAVFFDDSRLPIGARIVGPSGSEIGMLSIADIYQAHSIFQQGHPGS